ncbi:MAG TPA: hypothetical protein VJR05_03155 [Acidimicrobiia bacterium]|nr:hypothetical protein [Acidimicrobiia bacterium]
MKSDSAPELKFPEGASVVVVVAGGAVVVGAAVVVVGLGAAVVVVCRGAVVVVVGWGAAVVVVGAVVVVVVVLVVDEVVVTTDRSTPASDLWVVWLSTRPMTNGLERPCTSNSGGGGEVPITSWMTATHPAVAVNNASALLTNSLQS